MADAIDVREAEVADAAEVVRLLTQLGHPQPAGDPATRLAAFLGQGQRVLVAARLPSAPGSALLGAVTLHIMPVMHRAGPIGRLTAVVVDEGIRGKGVGRALVRASEAFLLGRGCAMIEITSNKSRADAHAFYERLGYTAASFRFAKQLGGAR
jgi:GNAT superfamily N-acetyltransferase